MVIIVCLMQQSFKLMLEICGGQLAVHCLAVQVPEARVDGLPLQGCATKRLLEPGALRIHQLVHHPMPEPEKVSAGIVQPGDGPLEFQLRHRQNLAQLNQPLRNHCRHRKSFRVRVVTARLMMLRMAVRDRGRRHSLPCGLGKGVFQQFQELLPDCLGCLRRALQGNTEERGQREA